MIHNLQQLIVSGLFFFLAFSVQAFAQEAPAAAPEFQNIKLTETGALEIEVFVPRPGVIVTDTSENLIEWRGVATNSVAETSVVTSRIAIDQQTLRFYRARQVGEFRADAASTVGQSADSIPFTVTVNGSGIEYWNEIVDVQRGALRLDAGQSRQERLLTAEAPMDVDLKLRARVRGTNTRLEFFERRRTFTPPFEELVLLRTLSCTVADFEFECVASNVPLKLERSVTYEWKLTVNGTSSLGDATAELIEHRKIPRSLRVEGTPFVKAASITRAESPKDLGTFFVRFSPTHGREVRDKSFTVSDGSADVQVVFSNNGSTTSGLETAHLIASITSLPPSLAAPSELTVVASSAPAVTLAWKDNTDRETGFRIERSQDGGKTFGVTGSNGSNVTRFEDNLVTWNTRYIYRVRAFSATEESANSNLAEITTPSRPLGDVFVDGAYGGGDSDGSPGRPFKTVLAGYAAASSGAILWIRSNTYRELLVMSKALRLEALAGTVVIGQ